MSPPSVLPENYRTFDENAKKLSGASQQHERVVNVEKLWKGEYPLWTDGKHVMTERLNVKPVSPVRERGLRMYEVRKPEEIPTRLGWKLPDWREENRVSLPAKNRIREMKSSSVGESMALSRNTFVGRAYRPGRRYRTGSPVEPRESLSLRSHASGRVSSQFEDPDTFRLKSSRDEKSEFNPPPPPQPQAFVPKSSSLYHTVKEETALQKTKFAGAQTSRTSRDLIDVTRWLCASGRALRHHREVGSARLELVA